MNTASQGAALQEVADRMSISGVIYRYCRAMDRIDPELGYSVWHEDGMADYGVIYRGSGRGFVDWVCGVHRTMLAHTHRVTNVLVTLHGDRAGSETYITVTLRRHDGDRLLQTTASGRYLDHWSRRQGRWAIDRRIYVHEFDEVREITETALAGTGRRDRKDPSYQVLTQSNW